MLRRVIEQLLAQVAILGALERIDRALAGSSSWRGTRIWTRANRSPGGPPRGSGTPLPRRRSRGAAVGARAES
jgi:hypothetical protein